MTWLQYNKAAAALGVSTSTLERRSKLSKSKPKHVSTRLGDRGCMLYDVGDAAPDVDNTEASLLVKERCDRYNRIAKKMEPKVHTVHMKGPFSVTHFGDMHVDDDGCDWPLLQKTLTAVRDTEGAYAGNIGDTTNNWVGGLQRLNKNQSTTEDDAWKLAEYVCQYTPWLYWVLGNHDLWNQGRTIHELHTRGADVTVMEPYEARIRMVSDDTGRDFKIVARHNFKNSSATNKNHGLVKASKVDHWGDLFVCGHLHHHAWSSEERDDGSGRMVYCARLSSFKKIDEYADALQFKRQRLGTSYTLIHDLDSDHPDLRCRKYLDVELAMKDLKKLRRSRGLK